MDPLSALLFAGLLTLAGVRTVGAAVTDTAAARKGKDPPSLEKWRAKRADRQGRATGEKPPSPWQRRWNNALETTNEKLAQRHTAKLERLRESERDNVDRRKQRLQRRADRREQVGQKLAGMGAASWDAAKQAAVKVRDSHAEKQAWAENARRESEAGEQESIPEHDDAAGTGVHTVEHTPESPDTADGDADVQAFPARHDNSQQPERDIDTARHDEGTTEMTTMQSGEITDLASALAYVTSSSEYCGQISGTFENAHAQASATAQQVSAQLATLEEAQSSLAGQGLDSEANRLAAVAENFSELVTAMQQVETLMAQTEEAISFAKTSLDTSAAEFRSQMSIAEAVQGHESVARETRFYQEA